MHGEAPTLVEHQRREISGRDDGDVGGLRRRAPRSSGRQFRRPGWRRRRPFPTAGPRRCCGQSPSAAVAIRPSAIGRRAAPVPRAISRYPVIWRRRCTGPGIHHVESRRRTPEVDDHGGAAVSRRGREGVHDPVGADLAGVVGQHRDAGADPGLDDHARQRRRSVRRASSATPAAPAGRWRRRRSRRSRDSRSPSRPRRSTAHSSAVRRSTVATRQSADTSPSRTRPSTVWLLPMSAARSRSWPVIGGRARGRRPSPSG